MAIDRIAYPLAAALLECLCEVLPETLAGAPCRCCVTPGPAPMDGCCGCGSGHGQAWTRIVRMYPTSQTFPQPLSTFPTSCMLPGSYAVELEMGVYRCAAVMGDDGVAPSCERVDFDAQVLADDAAAMRRALCCFMRDRSVIPGQWQPIGPTGGCMGGAQLVTVQVYDCCPPAVAQAR